MAIKYKPYRARSMINKLRHTDSWFWVEYSINPYRGCEHRCVYCDARANQYGLSETFNQTVFVKENAVAVLEKQLPRLKPGIVATGGVCDAYQPAEAKYRISRQVLEALNRHGFAVEIVTKSDLILRDLELLRDINENSWAGVLFTITTCDPQIAGLFEPYSPWPERRLAALERAAKAGLTTGVMMCPLLPGISDDEEHIEEVVQRAREAGAQFVLHGGLTLKRGVQRDRYFEALELHYPNLVSSYEEWYSESQSPDSEYARQVGQRARAICRKHGLPDRMKRPILPDDELAANKHLAEFLSDKVYDMELAGDEEHRIWAYRRAAWALEELEQEIGLIYQEGGRKGLESIKGVGKKLAQEIETWLAAEDL